MKTIWSRAAGGIELVTQEFGATDSSLAFHIPRPEDGAFSIRELPREDALALAAAIQAHYGAQPERPAEVPIPSGWAIRALATGGGPCDRCGQPYWTHVCLSCSPDYQTPGQGGSTPAEVRTDPTARAAAYRRAAGRHHPDRGGDPERFDKLTQARDVLDAIGDSNG